MASQVFFLTLKCSSGLPDVLGAEVDDAQEGSWKSHWVVSTLLGG
jgi:hypothetical protein